MSENLEIIASLYLPVSNNKLLLPNVSVAEVVDYQQPEKHDDTPDYYLGKVKWRGIQVPVLSYELANGADKVRRSRQARIAVINNIGEHAREMPFFAVMTQGIPRLVKISEDLIKTSRKKTGPADAALVRVDGEDAVIPNVTYLESLVYPHLNA